MDLINLSTGSKSRSFFYHVFILQSYSLLLLLAFGYLKIELAKAYVIPNLIAGLLIMTRESVYLILSK